MEEEKLSKLVEIISKQLDLHSGMSLKFIRESLMSIKKFDDKHTEKGLAGYTDFGPVGVMVKMAEKYNLLKEHYIVSDEDLTDEKVEELWQDVSVYSLMGKLVESGDWSADKSWEKR